MHDKYFKWDGRIWIKSISEMTGMAKDRLSDIGNALLLNGFTVKFPSEDIKECAINGTYEEEHTRWIMWESDRFCIVYQGRDDELYEKSKMIFGARWKNVHMMAPVESYREIMDFSELNDFIISQDANKAIEEYRKKESGFCVAKPKKKQENKKEKIGYIDPIEDLTDF